MNSIAPLITRTPGSEALNASLKSQYLGGSTKGTYNPGNYNSLLSSPSLSRSTSSSSLDSQAILRGGVPSGSNKFSQAVQTEPVLSTTATKNPSFLHSSYIPSQAVSASNILSGGVVSAAGAYGNYKTAMTDAKNASAHGVSLAPSINTIHQNNQTQKDYSVAGASLGAAFGPLGSIAGWAIGSAIAPKADLPTLNSFEGPVSANNAGIADSHSTASHDETPILQT